MLVIMCFVLSALLGVSVPCSGVTLETCYPVTGCFDTGALWSRGNHRLPPPQHPTQVSVIVFYHRRDNPDGIPFQVYPDIDSTIEVAYEKHTFVIFTGFLKSASSPEIENIKNALLDIYDCNIFIVSSNNEIPYEQAVSNARVVARLMVNLFDAEKLNGSDTHFIGAQLGAQTASLTAKEISDIFGDTVGRITALDPAGVEFEGQPEEVRLDWSDADYVDVLHTNSGNYGVSQPIGDTDFYINGGKLQPGCASAPSPGLCSHLMSLEYYLEAIKGSCMKGSPAYLRFGQNGHLQGITPAAGEAVPLSMQIVDPDIYFVDTNPTSPFCDSREQVKVAPY